MAIPQIKVPEVQMPDFLGTQLGVRQFKEGLKQAAHNRSMDRAQLGIEREKLGMAKKKQSQLDELFDWQKTDRVWQLFQRDVSMKGQTPDSWNSMAENWNKQLPPYLQIPVIDPNIPADMFDRMKYDVMTGGQSLVDDVKSKEAKGRIDYETKKQLEVERVRNEGRLDVANAPGVSERLLKMFNAAPEGSEEKEILRQMLAGGRQGTTGYQYRPGDTQKIVDDFNAKFGQPNYDPVSGEETGDYVRDMFGEVFAPGGERIEEFEALATGRELTPFQRNTVTAKRFITEAMATGDVNERANAIVEFRDRMNKSQKEAVLDLLSRPFPNPATPLLGNLGNTIEGAQAAAEARRKGLFKDFASVYQKQYGEAPEEPKEEVKEGDRELSYQERKKRVEEKIRESGDIPFSDMTNLAENYLRKSLGMPRNETPLQTQKRLTAPYENLSKNERESLGIKTDRLRRPPWLR